MREIPLLKIKQWWPLILFGLIILLLLIAPTQGDDRSGSTYSRDPSGYGAWYAYMEDRGTPVQRWRKSPEAWETYAQDYQQQNDRPCTLLQIYGEPAPYFPSLNPEAPSRLIAVGLKTPATLAPYRSHHPTAVGTVLLDTSRRLPLTELAEGEQVILADRFGVIAWERSPGSTLESTATGSTVGSTAIESTLGSTTIGSTAGSTVWITSPHLAANAYQDFRGNYEFLAQLATAAGGEVWVDEYLHGYRDVEPQAEGEPSLTWEQYLQQSSLMVILVQLAMGLGLLWIAQNQRFGVRLPLTAPPVDNTIAYIQALAGVLRQVNNHQFVGETLSKAEQRQVQQSLGLRGQSLTPSTLAEIYHTQTGRSPQEIKTLLTFPNPCGDPDLLRWLKTVAELRQSLNRNSQLK